MLLCPTAHAEPWTPTQQAIGAVALAATVIDFGQTRWIAIHCNTRERLNCVGEQNPILGKTPTVGMVNLYFAVVPIGAFFVADHIEHRTLFLAIAAGLEIAVTAHNARVGFRMSF